MQAANAGGLTGSRRITFAAASDDGLVSALAETGGVGSHASPGSTTKV